MVSEQTVFIARQRTLNHLPSMLMASPVVSSQAQSVHCRHLSARKAQQPFSCPLHGPAQQHARQMACTARKKLTNTRLSPCSSAAVAQATELHTAQAQQAEAPVLPIRVGYGFDLHRLVEGKKLIICGVDVPHTKGCEAHSDGDVGLHALTDAILGALCLPDIGQLFPDTDPKWKGANSDTFIKEAVRLMQERGYQLGNVDVTIIAQQPKLSPHKEKMRDQLCQLLGSHPTTVNIKAKTHEKVDSLGENRSIACHTVCTLLHS